MTPFHGLELKNYLTSNENSMPFRSICCILEVNVPSVVRNKVLDDLSTCGKAVELDALFGHWTDFILSRSPTKNMSSCSTLHPFNLKTKTKKMKKRLRTLNDAIFSIRQIQETHMPYSFVNW